MLAGVAPDQLAVAAEARAETLAEGELELLRGLVRRRQNRLRRDALKLSERLYRAKPRRVAHAVAAG